MFIYSAFWLPALSNPITGTIAIVVGVGIVTYQVIQNIKSSSHPFGSAPYADEVEAKRSSSQTYNKFVETENSPKPKVEGEQKTSENGTKAGKGSGIPKGREKVLGFPAPDPKFSGSLNDTSSPTSTAVIDTDNPNFYFNRDPQAALFRIQKRRLENRDGEISNPVDNPNPHPIDPEIDQTNISQVNSFNKTELNSPEVDPDRDKWIQVDNPSPITTVGQTQVQPFLNTTFEMRSAPIAGTDIAIFNPSEIVNAINQDQTSDKYFDNLFKTHLGHTEETEKDIKLSEQAIAFMPIGLVTGLNIEPVIGLRALYRIVEGFPCSRSQIQRKLKRY